MEQTQTGTDAIVCMAGPLQLVNHIRLLRWVNVFEGHENQVKFLYESKQAANEGARPAKAKRIACIQVVIEGQIGEGLEQS
jgi:hypothetical protein